MRQPQFEMLKGCLALKPLTLSKPALIRLKLKLPSGARIAAFDFFVSAFQCDQIWRFLKVLGINFLFADFWAILEYFTY